MAVNPDKNIVEQSLIARLIGKIKRIALDMGDSVTAETARAQAAEAAAKTEVVQGENCTIEKTTAADGHDVYTVNADGKPQVQSDWNQADSTKVDYVKNKPANLVQDANYVHTDNNYTNAEKTKLASIESGAQVNVIEKVKVNGAEQSITGKAVDISVPTASTATPLKDGTASAGSSSQWARGDHVHPTDDSREAVSNKKQVVNDSSTTEYPSSKAVADFVNSSVATNTANFLGTISESSLGLDYTATNVQIALALNVHSWVSTPTNNDYCFVSVNDPQTTDVDEYRRFKFNDELWAYEYTLNNSSFTQAQWDAINSGLTSSDRTTYNAAVTLLNTHVGDSGIHVTSSEKNAWNGKQDTVSTDTDSSEFGDNTSIATGFSSNKLHLNIASRLWTYIQGKISSVLGLTASSYGGKAATADSVSATAATANNARRVWFSDALDHSKRAYNDNFLYNPVTNILTTNISGNAATATSATSATTAAGYTNDGAIATALSSKAEKVTPATNGNFAGLDENGNLTDSEKKASDFATSAQGDKADSAIQGVKLDGASSALTPDSSKVATIPNAIATGTTGATNGLMTAADKQKLNGIASGAEVNQNAFSNVKVDSVNVAADSKTDTLELVAGGATTITADATNDKITISSTDQSVTAVGNHYTPATDSSAEKDASGGTATQLPTSSTGTLVQVVTGVQMDAKGHVTGVVSKGLWSPNSTYTNESLGHGYGTCSTAEATAAKTATLSNYALVKNGYVSIKFTYGLCANATLNINSKGAKSIFIDGAAVTATTAKRVLAGDIATFVYDGTQYQFLGTDKAERKFDINYRASDNALVFTKKFGTVS